MANRGPETKAQRYGIEGSLLPVDVRPLLPREVTGGRGEKSTTALCEQTALLKKSKHQAKQHPGDDSYLTLLSNETLSRYLGETE